MAVLSLYRHYTTNFTYHLETLNLFCDTDIDNAGHTLKWFEWSNNHETYYLHPWNIPHHRRQEEFAFIDVLLSVHVPAEGGDQPQREAHFSSFPSWPPVTFTLVSTPLKSLPAH